jgi:hypothetical protein
MALVEDTATDGTPASPEALIPEAREIQRRRRRRAGAVLLGLLILAGGGVVLFGGGGGPAVPTVHGPLPAGIAARAADPAGGLAWGLRVVRASGWTCVQLGRLRGGSLGVLGRDGSFGDDGRFHPFAPSTTNQAFCAQSDANGHAFLNIQLGAQAASGEGAGDRTPSQCQTAAHIAQATRVIRTRHPSALRTFLHSQSVCPGGDLRFVQYGLLGPAATSITYTLDGRRETERTYGPDGAYLVVAPSSPSACGRFGPGSNCGGTGSSSGARIFAGIITAVHYRQRPNLPTEPERPPRAGVSGHLPARRIRAGEVADQRVSGRGPGQRPSHHSQALLLHAKRVRELWVRASAGEGYRSVPSVRRAGARE